MRLPFLQVNPITLEVNSPGKGLILFINYISFVIFASIGLLFIRNKFDKIFVYEPSPITIGIPGIVAKFKFKAPIYFWVQDLWPEAISASGGVKNKMILSIFNELTKFIYRHCHKILLSSRSFKAYILNQNISEEKLVYFPNTTESYFQQLSPNLELLNSLPSGPKIMFAGNLGESQGFNTLLDAAFILKNKKIKLSWIILGEGRMKNYLVQRVKELELLDCFHLLGSYPSTEMPNFYSCADALIVSLKRDRIFGLTIPSKVQSYLACGKPILASIDGEGARVIKEAEAGLTCRAEDPEALVTIVQEFLSLSQIKRHEMGNKAREYFEKEFDREVLMNKLENILNH